MTRVPPQGTRALHFTAPAVVPFMVHDPGTQPRGALPGQPVKPGRRGSGHSALMGGSGALQAGGSIPRGGSSPYRCAQSTQLTWAWKKPCPEQRSMATNHSSGEVPQKTWAEAETEGGGQGVPGVLPVGPPLHPSRSRAGAGADGGPWAQPAPDLRAQALGLTNCRRPSKAHIPVPSRILDGGAFVTAPASKLAPPIR